MDIKDRVFEIQKLISENKTSKAITICEKLIKKFPDNAYFYNLCGLALQKEGQINKSVNYFQKALSFEQNNFAAMNNLANSYKSLYKYKKAEDLYKKIIIENPKDIKAFNNYANLKKEFNKYGEAKSFLLQALKIDSKDITILSNLATCCHGIGEIDEAKNYALKILELEPKNTSAHKLISGIINYSKEPKHLQTMKKILLDDDFENLSSSEKMDLCFALGKAYEDIKDFKNSYKFLNNANSIMRQNYNYNFSNTRKLFNNIIKLFENLKEEKSSKVKSEKQIIFICGMPRSGTTLVEQIIASHSKVSGAGELQYLERIINDNFLEDIKFNKQKIIEEMSKEKNTIFEKYVELLNFHHLNTNVITDKAPQNFIWIGFIKLFFPNSKIIHCSRNPKDNCLSLFKNYFPSKSMSWTYYQKAIPEYYKLYLKMMDFWKSKFKDSIFDANYEKIVNSPESEVKKMISFCDLTWEPGCLKFYQNKKTPVQTVSVSQASKPIYKSSVNSNQGYAEYLKEMFHILDTN
jgi:tetratricopeptide (TPR) repeat protein